MINFAAPPKVIRKRTLVRIVEGFLTMKGGAFLTKIGASYLTKITIY